MYWYMTWWLSGFQIPDFFIVRPLFVAINNIQKQKTDQFEEQQSTSDIQYQCHCMSG